MVFATNEANLRKASFTILQFLAGKNKNFMDQFTKDYPHEKVNKA